VIRSAQHEGRDREQPNQPTMVKAKFGGSVERFK
jgi:hypothetical protein